MRFTVRRLMVAVAIVAALLGTRHAWLMRGYYLERADHFRLIQWQLRSQGSHAGLEPLAWIAHYRSLEAKYERAARYPWLPVAPDPPGPTP
jgi:hypothetical protein